MAVYMGEFYIRCSLVSSVLPRVAFVSPGSGREIFALARWARPTVTFFIGGDKLRLGSTMFRRVTSAACREEIVSALNFLATRSFFCNWSLALRCVSTRNLKERQRGGEGENKVTRSKRIVDRSIGSDYWPRNNRVCKQRIESTRACSLLLSTERQLKGLVTRINFASVFVFCRWERRTSRYDYETNVSWRKFFTTWRIPRDVNVAFSSFSGVQVYRCISTHEIFVDVAAKCYCV